MKTIIKRVIPILIEIQSLDYAMIIQILFKDTKKEISIHENLLVFM